LSDVIYLPSNTLSLCKVEPRFIPNPTDDIIIQVQQELGVLQ
jgi:hypothetical protein